MSTGVVMVLEPGAAEQENGWRRALEEGQILCFPRTPFEVPDADRAFLLSQRQVEAGYHKNIAYRPAIEFAGRLLPTYARAWRVDFASFRPQEEAGRRLALRARNDLLHVDAFPTRPSGGDRILRVFTNINPTAPRVWQTAETFDELAARFAVPSGLLARARRAGGWQGLRRGLRAIGLPVAARSAYDEFMLQFHHFLKANQDYQEREAARVTHRFPPDSTWIVFTDMVSHAVLSGQYAVEQTFIVARASLALPDRAPIAILERLAGARLS
jgi:hypothetical protein